MANIDDKIFVALPDRIGLSANDCYFAELRGALQREAESARAITIIGGYFGVEFLFKLSTCVPMCRGKRTRFSLRIAVSIAPELAQAKAWQELRELKARLLKAGFENAEVKAIHRSPHVHTKLFLFMRGTQPSFYVGSFNPADGGRHELMVRVARKHNALTNYVNHVFDVAIDVANPVLDALNSLPKFFTSGAIAFRPVVPQLLTFDAFRFSSDERATLDAGGGQRIGVRYASPKTEGYGFRLDAAFEKRSLQPTDRLKSRSSSIETVLGFWVPGPYAKELQVAADIAESKRKDAFLDFGEQLRTSKAKKHAQTTFEEYFLDMEAMIKIRGRIKSRNIFDCRTNFAKFLDNRVKLLGNEERCARLARTIVLTPTPNLWGSENDPEAFESSFFDDLAYRLSGSGRRGRVLQSFVDALPEVSVYSDPVMLRDALSKRLARRAWQEIEWLRGSNES